METPQDTGIPTPLIMIGTVLIWIFQNFFLMDIMNAEIMSSFNWAMLILGYFVEIATAVLVVIRIYEKKKFILKAWKKMKKIFNKN